MSRVRRILANWWSGSLPTGDPDTLLANCWSGSYVSSTGDPDPWQLVIRMLASWWSWSLPSSDTDPCQLVIRTPYLPTGYPDPRQLVIRVPCQLVIRILAIWWSRSLANWWSESLPTSDPDPCQVVTRILANWGSLPTGDPDQAPSWFPVIAQAKVLPNVLMLSFSSESIRYLWFLCIWWYLNPGGLTIDLCENCNKSHFDWDLVSFFSQARFGVPERTKLKFLKFCHEECDLRDLQNKISSWLLPGTGFSSGVPSPATVTYCTCSK
jgi:hypothetical protein